MLPASRTPEGEPNRCPICGNALRLEPSRPPGDAPCPHCGSLVWFAASPDHANSVIVEPYAWFLVRWLGIVDGVPPGHFLGVAISAVREVLDARAVALWVRTEQGFRERCAFRCERFEWRPNADDEARTHHIVERAAKSNQTSMSPPRGAGSAKEHDLTHCPLIAVPLKRDDEVRAVIEVALRPEGWQAAQQPVVWFLEQVCDLAGSRICELAMAAVPPLPAPKKPWWRVWAK